MKNSKMSNEGSNSNLIILILVVCLLVVLVFSKGKKCKEGFTSNKNLEETTYNDAVQAFVEKLKQNEKYKNLDNQVLREIAIRDLNLYRYGLTERIDGNLNKYIFKTSLDPDNQNQCTVSRAADKNNYMHKNEMNYQPKIDMDKYVLKSSIPPEKKCPPKAEIDYSKYVLKSSIPPVQKCPPCICPKVKVEAGLCKKCPPPPKCPAPEPCPPPASCPEPKPCPKQGNCPEPKRCPTVKPDVLHKLKYIKVPTFIEKKVIVDKNGKVIDELINDKSVYNKNKTYKRYPNGNVLPNNDDKEVILQEELDNIDLPKQLPQIKPLFKCTKKKYYRVPTTISRSGIDRINNSNFGINSTYRNASSPINGHRQHIQF